MSNATPEQLNFTSAYDPNGNGLFSGGVFTGGDGQYWSPPGSWFVKPGNSAQLQTDVPYWLGSSSKARFIIRGFSTSSTLWTGNGQGQASLGGGGGGNNVATLAAPGEDGSATAYLASDGNFYFTPYGPGGGSNAPSGVITNWLQLTNLDSVLPGGTELKGFFDHSVSNFVHDPWELHEYGGGYAGQVDNEMASRGLGELMGDAGSLNWSNSLGKWKSGFHPEPDNSEHWFSALMGGMGCSINGRGYVFDSFVWTVDPGFFPGSATEFNTLIAFINLVLQVAIGFFLWWRIKSDVQEEMRVLFFIPQPTSGGTEIAGFKAGFLGQLATAAMVTAAIMVGIAKISAWVVDWSVSPYVSADWSTVKTAMETGVVPGAGYTVWLARVSEWVAKAFPIAFAFASISTWIAYCTFKWPIVRVTMVALKFVNGILCIPLAAGLFFLSAGSAGAVEPDVRSGLVHLVVAGAQAVSLELTNGQRLDYDATLGPINTLAPNAVAGVWLGSQQFGAPALSDGSLIVVDASGQVCFCLVPPAPVPWPGPTVEYWNRVLAWDTAGAGLGICLGLLSLVGFVHRRGLFPTGSWGGES